MTKKNLQGIAAALKPAAAQLPTQHTTTPGSAANVGEPLVQFSFGLRRSLRKELQRLAADQDMTMRAFILDALKEKGLSVTDDDLLDLRKKG